MAYQPETPGPQNPGKYVRVGPSYRYWGEQPGFVYNPFTDRYTADPKAQQAWAEQNGLAQPAAKQPGMAQTVGTTVGALAVYEAGKQIGGAGGTKIAGLINGNQAPAQGPATTPAAGNAFQTAPVATPTPAPQSGGMIAPTGNTPTAPTPGVDTGGAVMPQGMNGGASAQVPQGMEGATVQPDGTVLTRDGVTVDTQAGTATNADGTQIADAAPYVQGALGVLQVYGGVRQWQGGNKVGGGLNVAAGGANVGAALGSSTAASVAPGLNVAAYYGPSYYKYGKQLADGKTTQDSAVKTAMLSNLMTAWAVPIADAFGVSFGHNGKSKPQLMRDQVRDFEIKNNVINGEDFKLNFSDGSSFDLGADGGAKLQNAGKNLDGKTERRYTDVDWSDPRAGMVVGSVNPLAAIVTGGHKDLTSQFAGEFANAVMNGAPDNNSVNARVRELYQKHQLTQAGASQRIDQMVADKKIDEQTAAAYKNGVAQVFGKNAIDYSKPVGAPTSGGLISTKPGPAGSPTAQAGAARVQPLAPGQTPQSTAGAAVGPILPPVGNNIDPGFQKPLPGGMLAPPKRTNTRSPGIDKNGQRIRY